MPKDLTPRKIFYMLLRHVKLIFLITALVTLIVYGYSSFFITPVYSTSSLILIQSYNEDISVKSTKYYQATQAGRVAVSDIQQSASLASSCVILFENMPEMTSLMSGATVTFEQVQKNDVDSNFIRINVSSSNPQVAANVANQLADQSPKCFADMYGKGNGKVSKINSASVPASPSSPNVNQNTLYGLAIGFAIGILLSFMLEIIDTTLKPGDDISKMYNIPVFAEIVDFEKAG